MAAWDIIAEPSKAGYVGKIKSRCISIVDGNSPATTSGAAGSASTPIGGYTSTAAQSFHIDANCAAGAPTGTTAGSAVSAIGLYRTLQAQCLSDYAH
jgi:hypothetical protein